jgi:hypothetical protein
LGRLAALYPFCRDRELIVNRAFARVFVALFLMIGLWPLASFVFAAGDPTYSADVLVNSQSDDDRIAGLRIALGQVLARLSGDAGVATRADVLKASAQASNFVQQYQYVRSADSGANVPSAPLLLRAQFDPAAVDDLLRRLHLGGHENAAGNVVPEQGGNVRAWISGIRSAADYSRAMAALLSSDNVLMATPERAHDDGMLVALKLRSGMQRLLENLAAAQTLSPLSDAKAIDGVDLQLLFRP